MTTFLTPVVSRNTGVCESVRAGSWHAVTGNDPEWAIRDEWDKSSDTLWWSRGKQSTESNMTCWNAWASVIQWSILIFPVQ